MGKIMVQLCSVCGEPVPFDRTPPIHSGCRARVYKVSDPKLRIANTDRDLDIVKMRGEGITLQDIADKYGISRQRIEQILKKYDISGTEIVRNSRKERTLLYIIRYKADNDGNSPTINEMIVGTGQNQSSVRSSLYALESEGRIKIDNVGHIKVKVVGAKWSPPDEYLEDIEEFREQQTGQSRQDQQPQ